MALIKNQRSCFNTKTALKIKAVFLCVKYKNDFFLTSADFLNNEISVQQLIDS